MTTVAERRVAARLADDPALFCDRVLNAGFYSRQNDYARALRDNSRVAVLGANSTGKDYATGRLVWWWLTTRYPAKVVLLGANTLGKCTILSGVRLVRRTVRPAE